MRTKLFWLEYTIYTHELSEEDENQDWKTQILILSFVNYLYICAVCKKLENHKNGIKHLKKTTNNAHDYRGTCEADEGGCDSIS